MPILTKHQIVRITDVMMQAGGASAGHTGIVADHLAQANLTGYDSHWAQVEALFDQYGVRDQLADVLPSGGHP